MHAVMSTSILGSLPVRFLLLFLLPLLSESVSVYVANNGVDSPHCLQGSPNKPCKNLTLALEYIHDKNDSIVHIENGVYDLLPSSLTMFQSMRNITIAGEGTVEIACHYEANAGLTFLRSSDIHIHGICFSGCGVEHNSTSRDFNNENALSLLPFNATLYFEGCVNVTLDSVHVTKSLGIAVQFYTTTGTNMIINSNFSNNPSRAGQVIGGGVYIEFPCCQPGDTSCSNDASSVDINTISNSQYIINGSVFSNNMANSSKQQHRVVIPYKTYHDAFDRGGGLSIIFKGNARNNAVFLKNCSFEENHAVYGGGLYVNNNILLYKKSGVANTSTSIINTIGQQNTIQTELKVNFQDCPPGLFLNESEGKCVCYKGTFGCRLKCDQSTFTAELLRGFWIDKLNNETVVAHCPNCNFNFSGGYLSLGNSLDDAKQKLCSDNSKGRLCSTCMDGYAPAINFDEFKCVECSHKHQSAGVALFFFVDICCPIVFLLFLYWIDVPLTNGLLHGPIFFAQMITTIISLDADDIIQYQDIPNFVPSVTEGSENAYTTIYDFFNLEFFMFAQNMCLPHITKYVHIIALYYIPAFVPMILVFVLWLSYKGYNRNQNCIKARCINVCCQNVFSKLPKCLKVSFLNLPQRASNVLAMFILLSYAKIAVITGYLLTPVIFYKSNARSHEIAVYLDGSVDYLNLDHFIPAIIITVFFLIPVPLILMIFRFNDPKKNDGFFNYLLYQFQRQFRNGPEDIQSKTKELHERITGRVKNCLDHCSVEREGECCSGCCCGNGILYSYKCCKSIQLCSYTQQKYCCCAIHTSCSPYDYRWLSGGFFALQIFLLIPYIVAWDTIIRYILQFCICAVAAMLIIIFRPYKMDRYPYVDPNIVEAVCLILLSILIGFSMYQYTYTVIGIPLSKWAYVVQSIIVYLPLCWIICVFTALLCIECRKRWKRLKSQEHINDYVLFELANSSETAD